MALPLMTMLFLYFCVSIIVRFNKIQIMKRLTVIIALASLFIAPHVNAQRYGEDSMACITNLSLYIEDYKLFKEGTGSAESVDNMIQAWGWVFRNCPQATENIYVDGSTILDLKMERTKDEKLKAKLLDTLMMMYDQRIKYFGKEGFVLGRKGADLYVKAPERYPEAYEILKRSIELDGSNASNAVLVYYFRITSKMVSAGKLEKTAIVDAYDQVITILENNLALEPSKAASYETAIRNVELTFEPFANCEDLVNIYKAKFDKAAKDAETLRKILRILDKKSCTDNDLYFNANISLYKIEPTPTSAYFIGKMYLRRNDFVQAAEYLSRGTSMENLLDRADCFLLLAHAQTNLKNLPRARTAAMQAAELRPSDGRPFLLIGDMYAISAGDCGDNKLTKRVAYWAAVDKYVRAKAIDPSLEKEANEKIATYSRYFPVQNDVFFYELEEGQSYTVGCWINETTTVRALKQ